MIFNDPIDIVALDPQYVHSLIDIDLKTSDYNWTPSQWIEACNTCAIGIARRSSQAVGLVVCSRDCEIATIHKLAVYRRHRNNGVGTRLLQEAVGFAKQTNCRRIKIVVPESRVYPDNQACVSRFLSNRGFRAKAPFLPNCFCAWGRCENGVSFVGELST